VDSPVQAHAAAFAGPGAAAPLDARQQVSALYQEHAVALVKLAILMTGDQVTAEDVVQDAFLALYRRWPSLRDTGSALGYLRSSVLNGCRMIHRVRHRRQGVVLDPPAPADSAEAEAMLGEAHREVLLVLRQLPPRQREAVVLRYYLDMTEQQAAEAMGVGRGTVKSATSRGIAALARLLKEEESR
jgi:RNA polymerase sigma-70 factor (sigma-E family)